MAPDQPRLKALRILAFYLSLLESMLRWFESRGEQGAYARYAAAVAISVLLVVNLVTITMFAYGLGGVRWFELFGNIPLNILGISALVALHWWLIGRIPADARANDAPTYAEAHRRVPICLIYWAVSIVLLFAGVFVTIR